MNPHNKTSPFGHGFSNCHPLVQAIFFFIVCATTFFSTSPVFLTIALLGAGAYTIFLEGWQDGAKRILFCPVIILLMCLINGFFTHDGDTVLFYINSNRITSEGFLFGFWAGVLLAAIRRVCALVRKIWLWKKHIITPSKKELTPYGNQQGQVLYGSTPISELSPRKSACTFGFVMQNPDNQLVTEKVWQELAFGLENLGFSNSIIKRRVAEMASYFDISDIHRPVWQLSGGQKQLLNLASVMAMQPEVLLLDEPTSQLDPIAAREFLQTIYRINRELGTTVILCEHHLNEVFALADKVAVLEGGRLEVFGSPHEVANTLCKSTPPHPMFWGMPTVTQIFQESEQLPLTLREGRQQLEHLLCNKPSLPPSVSPAAPQPKQAPIVELRQLWFSYEKSEHPVLKNLSLQIQQGEWLSILGSNGAGKSTALKAMCGQIRPQQGSVLVENQNIARSKKSFLGAGGLA